MTLTIDDFDAFFEAVHEHTPFGWQRNLAAGVLGERWDHGWPTGIDLPTASGKTACLDVAIFTLAARAAEARAKGSGASRRVDLPRRVFFVVDRRIVVDEAYYRAEKIANELRTSEQGVVGRVAEALRWLACDDEQDQDAPPLLAARMRGGMKRDDAWVRDPARPAIITSTVDQVGSRLLFRAYGAGRLAAPIHAALTACDSLILLDEAHCAVPFMQTVNAVRGYNSSRWCGDGAGERLVKPLRLVVLSATLPDGESNNEPEIFPEPKERAKVLSDDRLRRRMKARKPAELVEVKKPAGKKIGTMDDPLVREVSIRAEKLTAEGHQRIAVMVNRVATATAVRDRLDEMESDAKKPLNADIILLTGRMRPIDRDYLLRRWEKHLRANEPEPYVVEGEVRPIIVVTTQCLEVGADYSFDALLSECAALDALRQRFGRLNRLGDKGATAAAVLVRSGDVKPEKQLSDEKPLDPLYGNALARTWHWLQKRKNREGEVDFGIDAMERQLPQDSKQLEKLNAPSPDAPIMLPAYIDLWCQTSERPEPEPDVGVFLHGPNRSLAEAQVVFRCDLDEAADEERWLEAVSLMPPCPGESLSVPLGVVRRWLGGAAAQKNDQVGDVEAQSEPVEPNSRGEVAEDTSRRFVLWRGRAESKVRTDPGQIAPGDTVVVSAMARPEVADWISRLGHHFNRPPEQALDLAETASRLRGRPMLRVSRAVLGPLEHIPPVAALLEYARPDEADADIVESDPTEWRRLVKEVVAHDSSAESGECVPPWLRETAEALASGTINSVADSEPGAVVLLASGQSLIDDEQADADDPAMADVEIKLKDHTADVVAATERFAQACLPGEMSTLVGAAAERHDLGKADARFQAMLRAMPITPDGIEPLAKGAMGRTRRQRSANRRHAGLPDGFRHEMTSMQLAELDDDLANNAHERDLVLHLIAAHHGFARPFAPVVDDDPPGIDARVNGAIAQLSAEQRRELPAHRLDSGVPERFWRLTRYYGWWGLAYIEAVLRLADWRASEAPTNASHTSSTRS